ncbi:hypothetical protein TrLO_g10435 [Triparma laevis f. longispina]|uniref:DM10 domain-containing protein n=1 Tax=Triparma laevis f. longispina TaxID=1714387 RepID=A0A9W7F3Q3_9STRA|nr:hypothetical protein TrLO_g10435 [Triparma laevis f. longispina]
MSNTIEVFAFLTEYFDQNAQLVKQFRINYFADGTVEILNPSRTKTIMKRIPYKELSLGMLYIGSAVTIFSRQYHVIDYADAGTRKRFEKLCGKAFGIVKNQSLPKTGEILAAVRGAGFVIGNLKTVVMDGETVLGVMASSEQASMEGAVSLFAETVLNLGHEMYVSATPEDVVKDCDDFFGNGSFKNSFKAGEESTLCLIKPHVIKDGNLGPIVSAIQESGFQFAAMQMFYLDRECAVEFFDVYRGVLPQFEEMTAHLIDGPVVALQIVGNNICEEFREMCGPVNVELAKTVRPKTFRAQFGHDFARSALHCTDLPEDGKLECKYFFEILSEI